MKTFAAFVFVSVAGPAVAASAAALVETPHFVCERGPFSRVAFKAEAVPCCVGQFGCPQLLSNTGLVRPKRDNRT